MNGLCSVFFYLSLIYISSYLVVSFEVGTEKDSSPSKHAARINNTTNNHDNNSATELLYSGKLIINFTILQLEYISDSH